jgi:hypothetical protein
MTSDGGYPDAQDDTFGSIIDSYRCAARLSGRRCQLFADHADAHAHAWLEPIHRTVRGGRTFPWRPQFVRWTDAGDQWPDDRSQRIRWCCMFRQ